MYIYIQICDIWNIYIYIYYILILSDILDGICADILSGYNWHTFLAYILAFFLAFYLASFQAFYLASIWDSIWHSTGIFSGIHFGILSGTHPDILSAFYHSIWHEFGSWHTPQHQSWAGVLEGWGKKWRKETRRQGGKEWVAPLSKSRYPHVAGGEKETLSFNLKQNQKTQVQNT